MAEPERVASTMDNQANTVVETLLDGGTSFLVIRVSLEPTKHSSWQQLPSVSVMERLALCTSLVCEDNDASNDVEADVDADINGEDVAGAHGSCRALLGIGGLRPSFKLMIEWFSSFN
jgi:hypothetical protein